MKERPILFSSVMVRALLSGTKTQTRRLLSVQDQQLTFVIAGGVLEHVAVGVGVGAYYLPFKYGRTGDRLWVKETWRTARGLDRCRPSQIAEGAPIEYVADQWKHGFGLQDKGKTRVSIFMSRWMSRITLEIVDVRIERLNDISEADAVAEGIRPVKFGAMDCGFEWSPEEDATDTARESYHRLWESINGAGSWSANPWVWVIEFRRCIS